MKILSDIAYKLNWVSIKLKNKIKKVKNWFNCNLNTLKGIQILLNLIHCLIDFAFSWFGIHQIQLKRNEMQIGVKKY
jgi:hypothetical protein